MRHRKREDFKEAERQLALRNLERVKGRWWTTTDVMPAPYGSAEADPEEEYEYYAQERAYSVPWHIKILIFLSTLFFFVFLIWILYGST